ncbi:hypothetical protein [Nesterenkonia halotolerans]|uniref:DUF3298 domain-containing protein n=1 Tax=Nesterenkonia halotolerans TaxID=225325 RepID=A0ABR9J3Z6_9MICC|nr:hypothetical protein [Nesterenkonia halotolerans]MBE1513718.1 hypothetical protein [Nesterenkonia halotolerans]
MTGSPRDHDQPPGGDDPLDTRLNYSAPAGTPATLEIQEELDRVSTETRKKAGKAPQHSRFRLSRGAACGLAAFLLVGGTTAAVAVTELRSYWADMGTEPHASYSFELPSGAECDVEVRMLSMGPPGVENTGDYSMTAEQDAFAREITSDAQSRVDELVKTERFQETLEVQSNFPGALDRSEDAAYFHAVDLELSFGIHIDHEDAMEDIRVGGYTVGHSCPGADFEGSWLEESNDMDAHETERGGMGG